MNRWGHGLFAGTNGIEIPLLYAAGAAALAFTGPGRYSLDALLGLTPSWSPLVTGIALAGGIIGAAANLAARRVPEPLAASAGAPSTRA